MSESVIVALIAGPVSAVLTLALAKLLGRKRDRIEVDALLAERWEAWSEHQDKRIKDLEDEVRALRGDLVAERDKSRRQSVLMSSLIQWALQLRDAVLQLGGHPPPAPPEVQAALTSLDAPI